MQLTQYKIFDITEHGNEYSVIWIDNSDLSIDQKVNFKEISGDFYIYRKYDTIDTDKIDIKQIKEPIYSLY